MENYVKQLATKTVDFTTTFYLGLFFGGLFGAAVTFILMQTR